MTAKRRSKPKSVCLNCGKPSVHGLCSDACIMEVQTAIWRGMAEKRLAK